MGHVGNGLPLVTEHAADPGGEMVQPSSHSSDLRRSGGLGPGVELASSQAVRDVGRVDDRSDQAAGQPVGDDHTEGHQPNPEAGEHQPGPEHPLGQLLGGDRGCDDSGAALVGQADGDQDIPAVVSPTVMLSASEAAQLHSGGALYRSAQNLPSG